MSLVARRHVGGGPPAYSLETREGWPVRNDEETGEFELVDDLGNIRARQVPAS